jgi:hypothetical protein
VLVKLEHVIAPLLLQLAEGEAISKATVVELDAVHPLIILVTVTE